MQADGTLVVQIYRDIFPDVPVVMVDEERGGLSLHATPDRTGASSDCARHVRRLPLWTTKCPGQISRPAKGATGIKWPCVKPVLSRPFWPDERSSAVGPIDYTERSRGCRATPGEHAAPISPPLRHSTITQPSGQIHNLNMMKIRVPQDISIIGYDNTEAAC